MLSPKGDSLMSALTGFTAALRGLQISSDGMNRVLERIATGQRINRAADGPAAIISSEYLRSAVTVLEAETYGLERTDMVIATADGALGEISDLLAEAEGLTVAASGDMISDEERAAYQMQLDSIEGTIGRITSTSSFAGQKLFDGSMTLSAAGQELAVDALDLGDFGDLSDAASVQSALGEAQGQVNTLRGELGAFSADTIGSALNAIGVTVENLSSAQSGIRDTDFALEIAHLARHDVLGKASMKALGALMTMEARVLDLIA